MGLLDTQNFRQRFISSIVILPILLFIIWQGGLLFNISIVFLAVIMSYEWLYIFYNDAPLKDIFNNKWSIFSIIYTMLFALSIMYLRGVEGGAKYICIVGFLVIASDVGAYFSGKFLGGPKILVSVSPNKTWSGLCGGIVLSIIMGIILSLIFAVGDILLFIIMGIVSSVVGHIGDFFESWVKRKFGVKDSSNIMPGHGGVLDRLDALMLVSILFAFLYVCGLRLI